jgi:hypothetical protein
MTQDEEETLSQLMTQDIIGQQTPTTDVNGYGLFASPGVATTSVMPTGLDVSSVAPGAGDVS